VALALLVVCMDVQTIEGCKVIPQTQFSFTYLAFASASLLVLLRIIAIWNYKKAVVIIAICLWVTNVAFLLQGIIRVRFVWLPEQRACASSNVDGIGLALIITLLTDILLLVIVLVGLLRVRRSGGGSFGLQGVLWKQGIIWLVLATLAEVPPVVLIILDLGVDTNLLFQFPSLAIMSIAATRMHRALVDYASGSTEITSNTFRNDANSIPRRTAAIPITLDRVEVSAHTTTEQYLGSQSSKCGSRISVDGQRCDPQNGLVIDRDLESGMEKSSH